MIPLLTLYQDCEQATDQIVARLRRSGLRVLCSFDLRQTSGIPEACDCPHHDTAVCDCQMIVLLVYAESVPPATLVAHGHNGQTWISLVDSPEQRPLPDLAQHITTALQSSIIVKG